MVQNVRYAAKLRTRISSAAADRATNFGVDSEQRTKQPELTIIVTRLFDNRKTHVRHPFLGYGTERANHVQGSPAQRIRLAAAASSARQLQLAASKRSIEVQHMDLVLRCRPIDVDTLDPQLGQHQTIERLTHFPT